MSSKLPIKAGMSQTCLDSSWCCPLLHLAIRHHKLTAWYSASCRKPQDRCNNGGKCAQGWVRQTFWLTVNSLLFSWPLFLSGGHGEDTGAPIRWRQGPWPLPLVAAFSPVPNRPNYQNPVFEFRTLIAANNYMNLVLLFCWLFSFFCGIALKRITGHGYPMENPSFSLQHLVAFPGTSIFSRGSEKNNFLLTTRFFWKKLQIPQNSCLLTNTDRWKTLLFRLPFTHRV